MKFKVISVLIIAIISQLSLSQTALADTDTTWKLSEIRIRDPFVVADQLTQTYYMYAQMGNRQQNQKGVEVYTSKDLDSWQGPYPVFTIPDSFWADHMVWAPEVHKYKNRYYLFVTFTSRDKLPGRSEQGIEQWKRGAQILAADSPKGPFEPFANRAHTPADWMALDGTLWLEDNTPYMIFCHEWVQINDGAMELVKLKDNLSDTIGNPTTLFKASDAPWARPVGSKKNGYVTDGPFLYKTNEGTLLMIWSSFGDNGYAIGLARSESNKVTGPWQQVEKPLFAANGGHGMIFKTFTGKLMLVLHQPNSGAKERAKFFELADKAHLLQLASDSPSQ